MLLEWCESSPIRADIQKRPKNLCACSAREPGQRRGNMVNAPFFVAVNQPGRDRAHVCASADEQEDDEKEGLEVE